MLVGAYFIVAIICGFITKSMNEKKGYDGGFLWGFLLSVIGIIVVALRPFNQIKQPGTPVSETATSSGTRTSMAYLSTNKETISEQPAQKDLWVTKRIKSLLASGMLPSDAKIKAEMEYSLVMDAPEELGTYNIDDILAIADIFFVMKTWSKAKLCYKAAYSIDDCNEKALIGIILSDLHRSSLEEWVKSKLVCKFTFG